MRWVWALKPSRWAWVHFCSPDPVLKWGAKREGQLPLCPTSHFIFSLYWCLLSISAESCCIYHVLKVMPSRTMRGFVNSNRLQQGFKIITLQHSRNRGLSGDSKSLHSVQSLSRVRLSATPWIAARQASLSITNSRSSLRLASIESVMPSSHLILCRPLLLLPLKKEFIGPGLHLRPVHADHARPPFQWTLNSVFSAYKNNNRRIRPPPDRGTLKIVSRLLIT